jgi:hypothetical protein
MDGNIKMYRRIATVVGVVLTLTLALAGPARAHHSYAMFDENKTVVLKGTVEKWSWANPHSFLEVNVPAPDGTNTLWELECASPSFLARIGMTRNSFATAEKVTVTIHPRRDGSNGGSLMTVVKADGKTISISNQFPQAGERPEEKR